MKKITLLLIGIGMAFTGFSQVPLYNYDFESGAGGWVIGGTGSWALGAPTNTIINSAASGTNAFVTNLTGNYNGNENGTVTSPSIDISAATGNEVLKMNVFWNSESSWDGANIFASYDGGATWAIVGANGDPNNWYNDGTINGTPNGSGTGWTGRNSSNNGSGGWVLAERALDPVQLVSGTSLMLRVGFGSDGSVSDEGFAFDDVFVGENLMNDAGIVGFPTLVGAAPGIQAIDVTLENFGTLPLTSTGMGWSINGVIQIAPPIWTGSIAPGASATVNLTPSYNVLAGTTTIKAWTSLPNGVVDLGPGNDTTEFTFCTGLSGTYTLGGVGADFATFDSLGTVLSSCGVSGPVIINVNPGTYTDRLVLDNVVGTSSINTITIDGGSASLVTLSNSTFSNVYLNGTDWTTIKNMTLENLGTLDSYGVQLRGVATSNTIDSCTINMNTTATNLNDVIGVSASDNETNDFAEGPNAYFTTVSNCQINGGEMGIHFEGRFNNRNVGNRFMNNVMDSCEDYGIYVDDQDSLQIVGNVITNLRSGNADGIYCFDIMMFDISYNKVVDAPDYGFYISDGNFDAVPTSRGKVINNMISSVSDYGMFLDDINQTDFFHNTVTNISASNAAFRINDVNGVDIRNNIFYSDGDYAFDSQDANIYGNNIVDFNCYLTSATSTKFVDDGFTLHLNLASWQAAQITANIGSVEIDPGFVSLSNDLHVNSPLIDNLGDATVAVLDDIDGDPRPAAIFPDMGADEFTAPPVDAGVIAFNNLTNPITPGIQAVDVIIKNFGALNLTGANIEWTVDGVAQTTFPWLGNLTAFTNDTTSIGSYNFTTGLTEVCAWSALPNGILDPVNGNDTTCMVFCTPLNGTYTLGGVGADFATFTELGGLLSTCGVDANVIVNVNPGTYTDRLILDHVPGASSTATITINGGDANLVTLSNTTFSNVYLNGTDWTTIKNMTLENLGTLDSYGVQLRDSAMNNTIDSCIINMETTATFLNDVIGVSASNTETSSFSEGQNAFWTTVSNNQINGGEKGIHFEGQFNNRNIGNRFMNNVMDSCEDYGIYVDEQDSIKISGNTITNLRNLNADGIYCFDIMMFDISYNNVVNAPDYGFYISDGNFDAVPTSRGKVINNMISSVSDYGMWLDDINQTDFFHNTVTNISASNAAFRINDVNGVDIRNNIFYSDGDYAFDSQDANIYGNNIVDFNSYFTTPASTKFVDDGFTVHLNLASWQAAQPLANSNSIEIDPVFVASGDLHVQSPLINDLGDISLLPIVIDDIDGDTRPASGSAFPDMGADEFTPINNNAVFEAFISPSSGMCGDSLTEVKVIIRSLGAIPITVMDINVNVTGDAVASLPFLYVGSLGFNQRDTVTVGTFNSYWGLNYDLTGYVDLAGEQDPSDDTLSTSITITPYEPRGIDGLACDGVDTATIFALNIPGAAYFWYDSLTGGTQVGSGDEFLIPSIAAQDTYYAEYVNNSDSIETTFASNNGCANGNMFDVTAISTITINAVSVNSNVGAGANTTVTVYYYPNATSFAQGFSAIGWTTVGTFTVVSAGANNATKVDFAGAGFTIPAGSTYAMYVQHNARYTNLLGLYSNADLSIEAEWGLCTAWSPFGARAFNGRLHYGTTACSPIRTPVTVDIDTSAVAAFTYTDNGFSVDFDATTTTNADSVLFDFDDGNSSTSLTPTNIYTTNGPFNVCLYAYSDCGIDTICQSVSLTVGVEELNSLTTARVFPNPSNGQFVLDLTNYEQDNLAVVVFNQLGKVIYSKSYSNNDQSKQHTIDLSAYSNGVYFLKLSSDKEVTTKKLIIQK